MTTPLTDFGPNGVDSIIEAAEAAVEPHPIDVDHPLTVVVTPRGAVLHKIEPDTERHLDWPKRRRGTVRLHDADSFARYVLKHRDVDATEVYADVTTQKVVAVLNDHGETLAGWADHRAELVLHKTDAWKRWAERDGTLGEQVEFAEHIEDSLADIAAPPAADLLEMAQSFQAHIAVQFESAKRLSSGERQLVYRENVTATAGATGQITIPETFTIGLAPYEGCELFEVTARLRYRLREGKLSIGYVLDRPEDVLRAAFNASLAEIERQLGFPVARGEAPAAR